MSKVENMKEWRTIEGLQADKDWLQQENDTLRAELLKAPDAKLVAFIADFELFLEGGCIFSVGVPSSRIQLWHEILASFQKKKAQHLGDDSEGE